MKVLITGSSPLLDKVIDQLLERGHMVSTYGVSPSGRAVPATLGQITNEATLVRACAGCDVVVHGADFNPEGQTWDVAIPAEINVMGTAWVCQAAARADVPRVVLLSTLEALGLPDATASTFGVTKFAAELVARHICERNGLGLLVLRLRPDLPAAQAAQAIGAACECAFHYQMHCITGDQWKEEDE